MSTHSEPIERLITELAKLPGIGRKTAARLAYYILRIPKGEAQELARAIMDVKERIQLCSVCFNLTDRDPCRICSDSRRNGEVICVVEEPSDLMAIEGTGDYNGKYHVLHGTLSPLEGIGPEDIKAKELVERVETGTVREVIMATNPNVEGGATALYLTKMLRPFGVKVTRIAAGIPMGGDIEYTDGPTLVKALEGRREI
jgi:recombination protein RecR